MTLCGSKPCHAGDVQRNAEFAHAVAQGVVMQPQQFRLNPIQYTATDMDTKKLKQEFGKDLTFWGGVIDPQGTLPHGTPQQVKDEVKRHIDDLAPGGGFVFCQIHNYQDDVPPQNIMAVYEALEEYGKY